MPVAIHIRPLKSGDDLDMITVLIRAAYSRLSNMGLRYWATFQSIDDTRQRFAGGYGLVAVRDNVVVGTLTVYPPNDASDVEVYRDPQTYSIGQFAVDPSHQGAGIGRADWRPHTNYESVVMVNDEFDCRGSIVPGIQS